MMKLQEKEVDKLMLAIDDAILAVHRGDKKLTRQLLERAKRECTLRWAARDAAPEIDESKGVRL